IKLDSDRKYLCAQLLTAPANPAGAPQEFALRSISISAHRPATDRKKSYGKVRRDSHNPQRVARRIYGNSMNYRKGAGIDITRKEGRSFLDRGIRSAAAIIRSSSTRIWIGIGYGSDRNNSCLAFPNGIEFFSSKHPDRSQKSLLHLCVCATLLITPISSSSRTKFRRRAVAMALGSTKSGAGSFRRFWPNQLDATSHRRCN